MIAFVVSGCHFKRRSLSKRLHSTWQSLASRQLLLSWQEVASEEASDSKGAPSSSAFYLFGRSWRDFVSWELKKMLLGSTWPDSWTFVDSVSSHLPQMPAFKSFSQLGAAASVLELAIDDDLFSVLLFGLTSLLAS